MLKILNFLVRRPGLTPQQFREHYENSHVPLAFKTFPQILEHHRYYATEGGAMFPPGVEQPWDAVVAITLKDRQGLEDMFALLADPELSREIVEDGDKFLDGPKCGMLIVEDEITRR